MARIAPDAPRADSTLLRPGNYLLALVWFQRKTGRDSGNRYLSIKLEVVGGRSKGATFFTVMGLDLSKSGTVTRWQIYAQACDVQEEFELGEYDDNTEAEGDENIRQLFLGVPFGCEVKAERSGQYENNTLGKYILPKLWQPVWAEWAQEWREARAARSQRRPEDDAGDPEPVDDGFSRDPATNGPEDVGYATPRAAPPPEAIDEDDIPF